MKRHHISIFILSVLLTATCYAEQSKTFGAYTIHYSAFTTDQLTPDVAKQYRIPRSKNRAMVNLSVLKNEDGPLGKPVKAKIEGAAKNLSEQLRELNIREIVEDNAIYYIAETQINNEETLRYNFHITPEGETSPYEVSFQEKFYTN
jgi:hypothetical protein